MGREQKGREKKRYKLIALFSKNDLVAFANSTKNMNNACVNKTHLQPCLF